MTAAEWKSLADRIEADALHRSAGVVQERLAAAVKQCRENAEYLEKKKC